MQRGRTAESDDILEMKRSKSTRSALSADIVLLIAYYSNVDIILSLMLCDKSCHFALTETQVWQYLVMRDFPKLKYYLTQKNPHHEAFTSKPVSFWQQVYRLKFFQQDGGYRLLSHLAKQCKQTKDLAPVEQQILTMKELQLIPALQNIGEDDFYECLKESVIYTVGHRNITVVNPDEDLGCEEREFKYETYIITPNAKILFHKADFYWFVYYADNGGHTPEYECTVTDTDSGKKFNMCNISKNHFFELAKLAGFDNVDVVTHFNDIFLHSALYEIGYERWIYKTFNWEEFNGQEEEEEYEEDE
jgi:hypothetical protein